MFASVASLHITLRKPFSHISATILKHQRPDTYFMRTFIDTPAQPFVPDIKRNLMHASNSITKQTQVQYRSQNSFKLVNNPLSRF